jgi:glycosyltransferase involved in cell wall biosynthesis
MRVALLFPHDPRGRPPGIDLVRLTALAAGLRARRVEADILAPVPRETRLQGLPVLPLAALKDPRAYDLVKTCYHQAIFLAEGFKGPLVARLVRVVDERHPRRDQPRRAELLRAQRVISQRAQAVAFNNRENLERWQRLYGEHLPGVLTPTGCPARLPPLGPNPYAPGRPAVVYAGSLASPRQVGMLNRVAQALGSLHSQAQVHLLGRNKSGLYGRRARLSPLVVDHGEKPPREVWNYLRWATAGLALAVGPEAFDNDSSKALHYLRAGLPLVCEEPILQGPLAQDLGLGRVSPYGDEAGLAQALADLLRDPPAPGRRRAARARMAREHGWGNTVEVYLELFARLLGGGSAP